MAIPQGYSWFPGFNAADGSLVVVSTDLSPYTLPTMGTILTPRSGLVNTYPVRTQSLSQRERGDGSISLNWSFAAMPIAAFQYVIATYLSGGTIVNTPFTIGTAQYGLSAIWVKFNCYLTLPTQGVDYQYDSNYVLNLNLRFTDLVAI